jgi:peptide/nickel transport system substrate-binding protein
MKYSVGVGGGLILGSGAVGLLHAVGEAAPGERVQRFVHTLVNPAHSVELGRMMALSFKEIGIEVDLDIQDISPFMAKTMQTHEAFLASLLWLGTPERIDPSFFLTEFFHSKHAQKGGRNYEHYRNPEYDKVCDAQNAEMDVEKRIKLVHNCQEILSKDYPLWGVGFANALNAYNSEEWQDPVSSMGCGVGSEFSPWTWLMVKPKTKRTKLITCNWADLTSLSLGVQSGDARANIRFIYDTFLKLDPYSKVIPWAAKSWKIVDGTTVDIVLREGMKFHDGKPVTIEDVKFTFDYLKDRKIAAYQSVYSVIEKTEILKDNTFRFHLVRPYAPFISDSLVFAHILPKHIWEKISDPDKYPNEHPIGNGPFKFGYWKRNQELYYEANKEHFSPPKIDGVYRKVIPSMDGIINAMKTKEVDFEQPRLSTEAAQELSKLPHITVVSTPDHSLTEIRGDLDKKPFSDLEFRKAVSHIIPREDYGDLVYGKAWIAASSIIHPKLKPWYNDRVPFDEYSIERARDILKKAGYTWDIKGLLHYPA